MEKDCSGLAEGHPPLPHDLLSFHLPIIPVRVQGSRDHHILTVDKDKDRDNPGASITDSMTMEMIRAKEGNVPGVSEIHFRVNRSLHHSLSPSLLLYAGHSKPGVLHTLATSSN